MANDSIKGIQDLFKYGAKKLSETPKPKRRGPSADEIRRNNLFDALDQNTLWQQGIVSGRPEDYGRLSTQRLARLKGYNVPSALGPQGTHVGIDVMDLLPGHRMQLIQEGVVTPEEMSTLEQNSHYAKKGSDL
jgi:hypothetical protein